MTTTDEQVKDVLLKSLGDAIDLKITRQRRIIVTIPRDNLKKTVNVLANELKTQHLSTITARDTGVVFEVLYHFFVNGSLLTIRTTCPRDDPTVDSIVDVFPSAILYEREIHDLLGIVPKAHPDLRRLVLPDDWSGGFPLRKDWKHQGGETVG